MIRRMLSERNLVVLVFILVLVIFSFAQEASKSLERMLPIEKAAVEPIKPAADKLAQSPEHLDQSPEYRD